MFTFCITTITILAVHDPATKAEFNDLQSNYLSPFFKMLLTSIFLQIMLSNYRPFNHMQKMQKKGNNDSGRKLEQD